MTSWIATLALLAGQVLPAAPVAAPLLPTGKWTIDFADAMCVASHSFGPTENPVILAIRPWPRSVFAEIVLISRESKPRKIAYEVAAIDAGEPGKVMKLGATAISNATGGQRIVTIHVSKWELERLAKANAATFIVDGDAWTLHLAAVPKALSALKACSDDLLRHWGIDPAEEQAVKTEAVSRFGFDNLFASPFYPGEAIAKHAQGVTTILWRIDADGTAKDCRVVGSSGNTALDKASCTQMLKAHFKPAIGQNGKPIATHSTMRIIWTLPFL